MSYEFTDDIEEWYDDDDEHGDACNCDECEHERAINECGELPQELGGGCSMAGSEYCDFDCPFRDQVLYGEDGEDQ